MDTFIRLSILASFLATLAVAIFAWNISFIELVSPPSFIVLFSVLVSLTPLIGIVINRNKDFGKETDLIQKTFLSLSFCIIILCTSILTYKYYSLPAFGCGDIGMPKKTLLLWLLIFTSSLFVTISLFRVGIKKKSTRKKKKNK